MSLPYEPRQDAGRLLADALLGRLGRDESLLILGLLRGGVPVAYEIATALHAPLDVFVVRKLGTPGHSEPAMGAVARGGVSLVNDDLVRSLGISQDEIEATHERERTELFRREHQYRGSLPELSLKDRNVVLVDDGATTGSMMPNMPTPDRQQSTPG